MPLAGTHTYFMTDSVDLGLEAWREEVLPEKLLELSAAEDLVMKLSLNHYEEGDEVGEPSNVATTEILVPKGQLGEESTLLAVRAWSKPIRENTDEVFADYDWIADSEGVFVAYKIDLQLRSA